METNQLNQYRKLQSLLFLTLVGVLVNVDQPLSAQLTPDNTLGAENSKITNLDQLRQKIDGGAIRGNSLFHSFLEFNVAENGSVYFSNPAGIHNILSRVTGGNASHILGTLGVLGKANLFLINPNGIIFGENAALDIKGSFYATTSDSIQWGENGFFSAIEPRKSNLLSVNPDTLFFNHAAKHQRSILNRGNLQVGEDLTLIADHLDLQGQLYSKGDLTLQGLKTVKIRDNVVNPFIAFAENDLVIQGNNSVDIFALNNSKSGLYAGNNMTLISANAVGGDAHFWTVGDFKIENLRGELGNLYSPHDPVIRSQGDVKFFAYQGASLHILAGGSVDINTILITGPDNIGNSINPTTTPELATVTLSNGETIIINGNQQPTVDIRAGVKPDKLGIPLGQLGDNGFFFDDSFDLINISNNSTIPKNSDIIIGDILIIAPSGLGLVLLTNQYESNPDLTDGNIILTGKGFSESGGISGFDTDVIMDSRHNISMKNSNINTIPLSTEISGNIKLLAKNSVSITENSSLSSNVLSQGQGGTILIDAKEVLLRDGSSILSTLSEEARGKAGNVKIVANSFSSISNTEPNLIVTGGAGIGNAGNIVIQANLIELNNTAILSSITENAIGNGGNITLQTDFLEITNDSLVTSGMTGKGNGGLIEIFGLTQPRTVKAKISNSGILSSVAPSGIGSGGQININADALTITNDSLITVGSNGKGNAGNLTIIGNQLTLDTSIINSGVLPDGIGSGGNIIVDYNNINLKNDSIIVSGLVNDEQGNSGQGNAGNITIPNAENINLNQSRITASTLGKGNTGEINIHANNQITLNNDSQITSFVGINATGNAQKITLNTPNLKLNNSEIDAATAGLGNAGTIETINNQIISLDNSLISTEITSTGEADQPSNIILHTQNLNLNNNSEITASTSGIGHAGSIEVSNAQTINLNQSKITASTSGQGNTGVINLQGNEQIVLNNNSEITSSVQENATGNAQKITLNTANLNLNNSRVNASTSGLGSAGSIEVSNAQIINLNQSQITASTSGQGNTGVINLQGNEQIALNNNSEITSSVQENATGNAQKITLNTANLNLNNSRVNATTAGLGNAGSIETVNNQTINLNNSSISTEITNTGKATQPSNITLNTGQINLNNNSEITASTSGIGDAGNISINAKTINLNNNSSILTIVEQQAIGEGGNINIRTSGNSINLNNRSQISSRSQGLGNAGNILINSLGSVRLTDSDISTTSEQESGGEIRIFGSIMRFRGDSDISTNVNSGIGGGGDIFLNANSIILYDDSDIFAFAQDGQGGNIILNTPVFFGEGYQRIRKRQNTDDLDNNNRVDLDASGAISGSIITPDLTFIRNSLTELPSNIINTEQLIANTCVVPNPNQTGTFIITESGGLPERPGHTNRSYYSTGSIQTLPNQDNSSPLDSEIIEPQGVFKLPDGRRILSRRCSK